MDDRHAQPSHVDPPRFDDDPANPITQPIHLRDAMVDLSILQADDALLDAIGSAGPYAVADDLTAEHVADDVPANQRMTSLLLAWRREVDSQPIGELISTDEAVAELAGANGVEPKRRRKALGPIAAAAAVLVIAFGGVSLAARDAQPGDTLWGLTQVLYSGHARSVEAAAHVRVDLQQARSALNSGQMSAAASELNQAGQVLPTVADEDGKATLQADHQQLVSQLNGVPPTATASSPIAPPPPSSTSSSPTSPLTSTPSTTSAPPSSASPPPSSPSTSPSSSIDSTSGSDSGSGATDGSSPRESQPPESLPPGINTDH
ncbi:MAG: hypothetical protein J2O49_04585 [Sciscionella sp.]|nr:hypothetical protein [Sciscionella sp.]